MFISKRLTFERQKMWETYNCTNETNNKGSCTGMKVIEVKQNCFALD